MRRELVKLVQSHPAHQCQKLDSSKPWYSWLLYTCPSGVWGVPVGDTRLPPSPCASAASPAFPSFHIFIHKTRGLFPSFDNVLWLCIQKRFWCWEGLRAGGEGDNRGWDGWMASLTRWTWVWVNSGSWWWTGRPGVLQFMGSQRVGHDWATELNWYCSHWGKQDETYTATLSTNFFFWRLLIFFS